MTKIKKILGLFAGTQSERKTLTEKYKIDEWQFDDKNGVWHGYKTSLTYRATLNYELVVEYIGIDIYSPKYKNIIFDLTQDNVVENLIKILPIDWIPDEILASPVCNKLSMATTGPKGNSYFIVENDNLRVRTAEEYAVVKHNGMNTRPEMWGKYVEEAKLALKMHENTLKIINHFAVPFYIENPQNSLAKYIYKDFVKNVAHYCEYGFDYKKATAIYSNKELNLLKCSDPKGLVHRHLKFANTNKTTNWPSHWDKNISTYANRSSVPPKLISQILEELSKETIKRSQND